MLMQKGRVLGQELSCVKKRNMETYSAKKGEHDE